MLHLPLITHCPHSDQIFKTCFYLFLHIASILHQCPKPIDLCMGILILIGDFLPIELGRLDKNHQIIKFPQYGKIMMYKILNMALLWKHTALPPSILTTQP